jgi:DNA-binding GntR family transcriptional regulator
MASGRARAGEEPPLDVLLPPRAAGPTGLATAVYEALRAAISHGQLPPHYHLRENPLAAHFGVSSTPVREALRRLEREGLVVVRPNRGAVVQAFDRRSALNLYEVRELLEVEAVRQAALAPERDLRPAERLLEDLARLEAADRGRRGSGAARRGRRASAAAESDRGGPPADPLAQLAAGVGPDGRGGGHADGRALLWPIDVAFHRAVNEIGPNHLLADLAERTHRQIQAVRARAGMVTPGIPGRSNAEHAALLDAVRRRDADEAERLVREHIRAVRDRVLPALERLIDPRPA